MSLASRIHPQHWIAPLVVSLLSFALTAIALDPGGDAPQMPAGPGPTLDESFNVQQGVYLARSLPSMAQGVTTEEIFASEAYLPDHPPLGRVWLGAAHEIAASLSQRDLEPAEVRLYFARFGSAAAFALTIFIVGWVSSCWYGPGTGLCASLAMLLMPRLWGHAHLAALETVTNLFFTVAALAIANWWTGEKPPTKKAALFCGFLWGLAMLTKIQGVLLMVPVGIWGLCFWRQRAIVPGMLFGLAGAATLFALWPWLWLDPLTHLQEYLGRTTDRSVNKVFYMHEVFVDHLSPDVPELAEYREIPWHYPLVMSLVTVPLSFLILGLIGLKSGFTERRLDGKMQFLLTCILFPLVLFSLPGIAVYDGVRLYLIVFPLWAILVGRGGAACWSWLSTKASVLGQIFWVTLFAGAQVASMWLVYPSLLSDYSLGVGSLRGAEMLGFEVTYWGDSLDRDFQEQVVAAVPENARIGVVPVLHQFQIQDLAQQSLIFRQHGIELVPFDPTHEDQPEYVITFFRQADHSQQLTAILADSELLVENLKQDVRLAGLYRLPNRE